MSSKNPIAYIEIRVFAHATEEEDKVLKALHNILTQETIESTPVRKTALVGHHGNPITLFEMKIRDKNLTQKVFEKLASGLSVLDKEMLMNEVLQHIEKGNLYLRIDKQSAYLNQIRLSSVDPIHLRIHFKNPKKEEVIENCRKYGLLP